MNTLYDTITETLADTSWDDVATGLVCASFCAASASLFVVMFTGAA